MTAIAQHDPHSQHELGLPVAHHGVASSSVVRASELIMEGNNFVSRVSPLHAPGSERGEPLSRFLGREEERPWERGWEGKGVRIPSGARVYSGFPFAGKILSTPKNKLLRQSTEQQQKTKKIPPGFFSGISEVCSLTMYSFFLGVRIN